VRILALDTTTNYRSVAILDETRLVAEVDSESSPSHSTRLLKSIDHLMRLASWDIEDIDGFAAAAGPGSFTGIRVGLSTIKALSFASGKPVAPVSTLAALAAKLRDIGGRLLCPLIDAKKGEVYGALYESSGEELKEIIPQGVYGPEALFSSLPSGRVVHFLGTGVETYGEKIRSRFGDRARFPDRSLFIAREVGVLGREILVGGLGVKGEALEPIYFRKSQAEEKK
jgi:tRNA threonylcarbamoyladenosine biosynthesis protein TsaB